MNKVIYACCVLHNFVINEQGVSENHVEEQPSESEDLIPTDDVDVELLDQEGGQEKRNQIAQYLYELR